jgi:RNA polymerase sigma-70 factor, ECF subfamily
MHPIEREIRENHGDLRRFAYRMVGDAADDVLQDSYVKAFRSWRRFAGAPERRRRWLYRIVYRTALDQLRRQGRSRQVRSLAGNEAASDPEGRADVAAALARLPDQQRAAVLLVDMIGLTYDEAAKVCGVPRGTIASRLNHARIDLRQQLRDYLEADVGRVD